jgi:hypothetical protein
MARISPKKLRQLARETVEFKRHPEDVIERAELNTAQATAFRRMVDRVIEQREAEKAQEGAPA